MSPTGTEVLTAATRALAAAGVPEPAGDARRLFSHALGLASGRLTLVLPEPVDSTGLQIFDGLITRRCAREPVSQLIGYRAFYGRDFIVTSDVLDPRPETETLIEAALALPFKHVLDLGTGSGCILLTLLAENPSAQGVGADLSSAAVRVAARNARALDLSARAAFVVSDWTRAVTGVFDLIVANPPYIAANELDGLAPEVRDWEPRIALTDNADGLEAYRNILRSAPAFLMGHGRLIVEIGPTQATAVIEMALEAGFDRASVICDLDGRDRVIVMTSAEIPF